VIAVVFALLSALMYAVASVLQQRAAAATPHEHSLRIGLLAKLVVNPLWLIGIAADVGGYACQFVALGHGGLALVQPLLVSGLLFALPLGAFLRGTRLTRSDWVGAVAVVAGLSAFLLMARPEAGNAEISGTAWTVLIVVTGLFVCGLVLLAGKGPSRRKAVFLASSAGVLYGLTAALTKASSHLLQHGVIHTLTRWEPYGLASAGLIGMLLTQSAFQAGPLDASLPALTVIDPVVSIAIGAVAFAESLTTGVLAVSVETAGMIAMVAGVFLVSRSEAVMSLEEPASSGEAGQVESQGRGPGGIVGQDHAGVSRPIGPGQPPGPEPHHRDTRAQRQADL
jgi:drug/metabolite transporter (DMT)-like permease